MQNPSANLAPALVSEENSQKELAGTIVSRPVAKAMSIGFCALLLLPLLAQLIYGPPDSGTLSKLRAAFSPPSRDSLEELSKLAGDSSVLKNWVQPRLQSWLTGTGGFGNDKVVVADNGRLYYAPGLHCLFGQPFRDPDYLRAKAKKMIDKDGLPTASPDPLPAFVQLAADCRRLGIHLVLVPVPDKAGELSPAKLQNTSFPAFRSAVESQGAEFLIPEDIESPFGEPLYLKYDTHWTPAFMERVAKAAAQRLAAKGLGGDLTPLFRRADRVISGRGDMIGMLGLPSDQKLFGAETVTIGEIAPVGKTPAPTVMLIGDSFANMYSSESLGWGARAGFSEHIAFHLNAPVDAITLNGGGSKVRHELLRAARSGRMAETKALVYEFAVRDLYLEDWPVVGLGEFERRERPAPKAPEPVRSAPEGLVVRGTIVQISRPINPDSAPYEDALLYGKIKIEKVESGRYGPGEMIVAFLAMEKRKLLVGAGHKVGDPIRLKLIELKNAPPAVKAMQRSDDTEDFDLTPYFVQQELP